MLPHCTCVIADTDCGRPAYLQLGHVIRERLNVKCVLALTATATISTLSSIVEAFGIPPAGMLAWMQLVLCGMRYTSPACHRAQESSAGSWSPRTSSSPPRMKPISFPGWWSYCGFLISRVLSLYIARASSIQSRCAPRHAMLPLFTENSIRPPCTPPGCQLPARARHRCCPVSCRSFQRGTCKPTHESRYLNCSITCSVHAGAQASSVSLHERQAAGSCGYDSVWDGPGQAQHTRRDTLPYAQESGELCAGGGARGPRRQKSALPHARQP